MSEKLCKRCAVIGGAPFGNDELSFIKEHIKKDDYIICADSGYDKCRLLNIKPDLIVGDMDSLQEKKLDNVKHIKLPVKKDDTDTFYAVKQGISEGFTYFAVFGALGGELDHSFANVSLLMYLAKKNVKACLMTKQYNINILLGKEYNLPQQGFMTVCNKKGKHFSVFAFGCEKCTVEYKGAEYSPKNSVLKACKPYGVRNVFSENYAEITLKQGCAVVIIYN